MKKLFGAFIFLILIVIFAAYTQTGKPIPFLNISGTVPQKAVIDGHSFSLLIAQTDQEHETGLSGKDRLPQNQGMLFLFKQPASQTFWMKGMKFPLDIIYIDTNNKIVSIFKNLENPTPFDPTIRTVTPTQPANKVLEINAGLSDKYSFKVGDEVKFLYQ